jgi:Mg2+-importing ATPase
MVHRTTALTELARLFATPLIAILLIATGVSAAIGEWVNATIIIAMVLLGIVIN